MKQQFEDPNEAPLCITALVFHNFIVSTNKIKTIYKTEPPIQTFHNKILISYHLHGYSRRVMSFNVQVISYFLYYLKGHYYFITAAEMLTAKGLCML